MQTHEERSASGASVSEDATADLTVLLQKARHGDRTASESLFQRVYAELHRLARAQLLFHGRPGITLDTTALVHEAYLRLASPASLVAEDRAHFYNLVARVMRHVIIDFARRRDADRRGGEFVRVELAAANHVGREDDGLSAEILALDRALETLERTSPDLARLVELRFFAGVPLEEIAEIVGRSERSLKRDWRRARAFLHAVLAGVVSLPPETSA